MTLHTVLLASHIVCVAAWLGADIVQYVVVPRLDREGSTVATAWARQELFLHERYYALVAIGVLVTGIAMLVDGPYTWRSWFVWVGVLAIVGGATIGGGGLGGLAKRRLAALESGDEATATKARRKMIPLQYLVTALPVLAILAMVQHWHAVV
jgi:hypothetical protein